MVYDFDGNPDRSPPKLKDEGMSLERLEELIQFAEKVRNEGFGVAPTILAECIKEIARQRRIVEAENAGALQALAEMDKANYLTIVRERDQVYAELKEALEAGTTYPVELIAQAKKWRDLAKGTAAQIGEERKRWDDGLRSLSEGMKVLRENASEQIRLADEESNRKSETIRTLEKERDHWREARRTAIEGGEILVKQRDELTKTVASLQAEVRAMKPVIAVADRVASSTTTSRGPGFDEMVNLRVAINRMDAELTDLAKGKIEPSPHFCEHANEVPQGCPCPSGCYCQQEGNTCGSKS
jgi:hypothetical protein